MPYFAVPSLFSFAPMLPPTASLRLRRGHALEDDIHRTYVAHIRTFRDIVYSNILGGLGSRTVHMNNWVCYVLAAVDGTNRTYVGATIDPDRRLRQHNGEISGGAKATAGRQWRRVCYVRGFSSGRVALQFEWRWKYYSRKEKGTGIERRLAALRKCMEDTKWTGATLEQVDETFPPVISHTNE